MLVRRVRIDGADKVGANFARTGDAPPKHAVVFAVFVGHCQLELFVTNDEN